MNNYTVTLEHITRQQIEILAETEEDAAILVHGIFAGTDVAEHLPIRSAGHRIICGNTKIAIPEMTIDDPCDHQDEDGADDNEIDLVSNVRCAVNHAMMALNELADALDELEDD